MNQAFLLKLTGTGTIADLKTTGEILHDSGMMDIAGRGIFVLPSPLP